jgi:baculoviral IAP repeat-containing protein 7/8
MCFEPFYWLRRRRQQTIMENHQHYYHDEARRLFSFADWNHSAIRSQDLAKAGFFYLGHGDRVKCCFCNIIIGEWEVTDVPLTEHIRHSPNCPFVNNRLTSNVPLSSARLDTTDIPRIVTTNYRAKYMVKLQALPCMFTDGGPRNLSYISYEKRLKTFEECGWDITKRPSIELMSKAGFHCLSDDYAVCYYCDTLFTDWGKNQNPFEEHRKYHPSCLLCYLPEREEENVEEKDIDTMSIEEIKNELSIKRNETLCKVCQMKKVSHIFLECGHFSCVDCVKNLKTCPECRTCIRFILKVFL